MSLLLCCRLPSCAALYPTVGFGLILTAPFQNDRWLTPDHGFPVRMIIPGFIGGRMVKFLEEITVTEKESDNFYHFHDNRVMPPHVDEELAKKEGEQHPPPSARTRSLQRPTELAKNWKVSASVC